LSRNGSGDFFFVHLAHIGLKMELKRPDFSGWTSQNTGQLPRPPEPQSSYLHAERNINPYRLPLFEPAAATFGAAFFTAPCVSAPHPPFFPHPAKNQ